jgi:stage III sporulation protein AE
MKKYLIIVIFIILYILIKPISVQALDNINTDLNNSKQIDVIDQYINNIKNNYDLMKDMDVKNYIDSYIKTGDGKFSFQKALSGLIIYASKEIVASLKLMSMLIVIAIVSALISNLEKAFNNDNMTNIAYFACFLMLIIIIINSFYISANYAKDTINKLTDFMAMIMPVLMLLLASVGGFTEAAVMDPIIVGVINLSARFYLDFIIPLIFLGFVLQFVNNISNDYKIDRLTKLFKQIAIWTQGIVMTVFIGIVTVRGITSKTIDQVTAKTAKYAVDNFVPIVGKSLSDAISTVAGYSILLKNAISSLGLVVIIIIVITPIIKLLIMAFLYKFTAALIEPISDKRIVDCISSVGDSLILLNSCLLSISVMFFIIISIIASAGKMAIGG